MKIHYILSRCHIVKVKIFHDDWDFVTVAINILKRRMCKKKTNELTVTECRFDLPVLIMTKGSYCFRSNLEQDHLGSLTLIDMAASMA